eukprot:s1268_g8.t3
MVFMFSSWFRYFCFFQKAGAMVVAEFPAEWDDEGELGNHGVYGQESYDQDGDVDDTYEQDQQEEAGDGMDDVASDMQNENENGDHDGTYEEAQEDDPDEFEEVAEEIQEEDVEQAETDQDNHGWDSAHYESSRKRKRNRAGQKWGFWHRKRERWSQHTHKEEDVEQAETDQDNHGWDSAHYESSRKRNRGGQNWGSWHQKRGRWSEHTHKEQTDNQEQQSGVQMFIHGNHGNYHIQMPALPAQPAESAWQGAPKMQALPVQPAESAWQGAPKGQNFRARDSQEVPFVPPPPPPAVKVPKAVAMKAMKLATCTLPKISTIAFCSIQHGPAYEEDRDLTFHQTLAIPTGASQFPLGPGSKSGKQNGDTDSNANKPCKFVCALSFVDVAGIAFWTMFASLSSMHGSFSAFLVAFTGFCFLAFSFQKAFRGTSVINQPLGDTFFLVQNFMQTVLHELLALPASCVAVLFAGHQPALSSPHVRYQVSLRLGLRSGRQNGDIDSNATKSCKLVCALRFVPVAGIAFWIMFAPLSSMRASFSACPVVFTGFCFLAFSLQKASCGMSVVSQPLGENAFQVRSFMQTVLHELLALPASCVAVSFVGDRQAPSRFHVQNLHRIVKPDLMGGTGTCEVGSKQWFDSIMAGLAARHLKPPLKQARMLVDNEQTLSPLQKASSLKHQLDIICGAAYKAQLAWQKTTTAADPMSKSDEAQTWRPRTRDWKIGKPASEAEPIGSGEHSDAFRFQADGDPLGHLWSRKPGAHFICGSEAARVVRSIPAHAPPPGLFSLITLQPTPRSEASPVETLVVYPDNSHHMTKVYLTHLGTGKLIPVDWTTVSLAAIESVEILLEWWRDMTEGDAVLFLMNW